MSFFVITSNSKLVVLCLEKTHLNYQVIDFIISGMLLSKKAKCTFYTFTSLEAKRTGLKSSTQSFKSILRIVNILRVLITLVASSCIF